jgi:hypothetical protein
MALKIIDASGPMISAKISGELSKSEVSQMQAAALARRSGAAARSARYSFSIIFRGGSGRVAGAMSAF